MLSLVGLLSPEELATVAKRLGAKSATVPVGTDVELVLDAICSTLQHMGVEYTQPSQLRTAQGYAAFAGKVSALMLYVRRGAPTRNQQRALLGLGITYLYDNLCEMGLPVSARLVMAHAHRLPSVINAAFPGYAQAGLLGMLVKGEKHVHD